MTDARRTSRVRGPHWALAVMAGPALPPAAPPRPDACVTSSLERLRASFRILRESAAKVR